MSVHTPGPWTWFDYPDGRKLLVAASRAVIHCPDAAVACDAADARLIAAAPEMYEALKDADELLRGGLQVDYDAVMSSLGRIGAAIAKAEGAS